MTMNDYDDHPTLQLAGRRLREERERRGLSLDEASAAIGLGHRSQLSRIETGKSGLDSIVLRRAATFYDVGMDAFFTERPAGDLVVKARRGDADDLAAREMAAFLRRKLDEWYYLTGEVRARGL